MVRFYKGATGLKTGSTDKAKFCVSATAKRNGMHLICVIMGTPSSDVRNTIATQLLNWGFANFELYTDPQAPMDNIKIKMGVENECQIQSAEFRVVIKKGDGNRIEKNILMPNVITAPIHKGDEIGYVEYSINGKGVGKAPIISTVTVEKIDFWTLFVRILSKFLIK